MPFKLIYNLVHFSGNYRSYIMPTAQLKSCLSISLFDFHLNVKLFMSTSIFLETVRKNLIKVKESYPLDYPLVSSPDWLSCHGYRNTLGSSTTFNYMGGFILLFDVSVDISYGISNGILPR